ncbi:MAG: hypothetical protein NT001_00095 [Candidatus Woesearchaeota archaeon]|nr:hypothetical protein [Candidatus Woesearchaeota archaeon]
MIWEELFNSKKAQTGSSEDDEEEGGEEDAYAFTHEFPLVAVLAIIIPLAAMVFAIFVTGYQVQENSFLGNSENVVIQSRFFNSPLCFAYQDTATNRVYPGIIDLSKFGQERMDLCYEVPENYISGCFRIQLKNLDTNKIIGSVESKNFGKCITNYQIRKDPYYVVLKSGDSDERFAGLMLIESRAG